MTGPAYHPDHAAIATIGPIHGGKMQKILPYLLGNILKIAGCCVFKQPANQITCQSSLASITITMATTARLNHVALMKRVVHMPT